MIDSSLIARINELSKKKKEGSLTEVESIELNQLRQEYLRLFREGLKQTLDHVKVIDKDGNDITPKKGNA